MADDNKIIVDIEARLDKLEKGIKQASDKAEQSFQDLGKNIQEILEGGVGGALTGLVKQFAVAGIGFLALKETFSLVLEGEHINALNQQFEVLTKNVGLSGDALKDSLIKAGDGLVEDTALIESANKAIIELGRNAGVIPETLELARKASVAFGTDTLQTFELINQAIANGNVRSLRQIGITIDQDVALKKYANSIGATVSSLTDAGRKQALLNEVLEKGQKAFEGIDPTVLKAKNSFTEFKNAIAEVKDAVAVSASGTFGKIFSSVFGSAATSIKETTEEYKRLSGQINSNAPDQKIKDLTAELDKLNSKIAETGKTVITTVQNGDFGEKLFGTFDAGARVKEIESQLDTLVQSQQKAQAHAFLAAKSGGENTGAPKVELFNQQQVDADREKLLTAIAQTNAQVLAIQQQGQTEQQLAFNKSAGEQLLVQQQFDQQQADIELQKRTATQAQKQLLDDQELANEALKNAKLIELRQQADSTGLAISKSFQQGVAGTLSNSIQTIVGNLAKGKDAFSNFGKVILGFLGDLAIQVGTVVLSTGIAYQSLGDFTGTSPILFGGALIALGTILKAFSGSGGADAVASGGGSGFSTPGFGGEDISRQAILDPNATRAKGTQISVNIQGNVLDRRQSGLEIANIIQEQFDTSGNVIAQGGIA